MVQNFELVNIYKTNKQTKEKKRIIWRHRCWIKKNSKKRWTTFFYRGSILVWISNHAHALWNRRYPAKRALPTHRAYSWQMGPFWQDTLEMWVKLLLHSHSLRFNNILFCSHPLLSSRANGCKQFGKVGPTTRPRRHAIRCYQVISCGITGSRYVIQFCPRL